MTKMATKKWSSSSSQWRSSWPANQSFYITQLKGLFVCRNCGVRLGFVLLMSLTYTTFGKHLNMCVMCDVSGPDVDDCSKNGKKAAEAMSLSKEGKSAQYHLQDTAKCVFCLGHLKTRKHKPIILLACACIAVHVHWPVKVSMNCASAFLWSPSRDGE